MYRELANKISKSPIQHKFLIEAEKYKNLALEFNRTQNLEDDIILTDSVIEEDELVEPTPLISYDDFNSSNNDNSCDLMEGHYWGSGESLDSILGNSPSYDGGSSRGV